MTFFFLKKIGKLGSKDKKVQFKKTNILDDWVLL